MTDHLFVYGTLKRRSPHPMARQLARRAAYAGEARMSGRLYLVDPYPCVVASAAPDDIVAGDLFRLRGHDLLDALDAYEGCGPSDPAPTEFVRSLCCVRKAGGGEVIAWVYLYNRSVAGLRRIASGRFDVERTA